VHFRNLHYKSVLKVAVPLAVLTVLVAAAAIGWVKLAPRHVPPGQPPLLTLDDGSLSAFRDAFNASEGEVRVLAMFSPT
jgi:hypothetical protein